MAISTNVYFGQEWRVGIAEESTFGTAITTQSNFKELEITAPPQIDFSGVVRDQRKRADGSRVLDSKDVYLSQVGGEGYTCQIEGILTDITADLLLYGAMQDIVSEAATSPYLKTFEWDNATDGDNSGSPFKFFTLDIDNPIAAESEELKTCVIKTLTISSDPGTNGGRASFSATFWTGFAPSRNLGTATDPTQWTAPGTDYYVHQLLKTKTLGGSDLVVGSFSVNFENNVKRVGYDSSGDPQAYVFGPTFDVTGDLSVKYDANTQNEIDYFITNPEGGSAERALIIQWGNGTGNGTLKFLINAIYTGAPNKSFEDKGTFVTIPWQGVTDQADGVGTNEAIEVLIANDVDRVWTA
ncbi:MAG: hypothetical protein ACE5D7_00815 [Fidelibacterota bacterium]